EKAVRDLCKALELDPKRQHGWYDRGGVYLGLGQFDKAARDLSRFIEVAPNHPLLVQAYLLRARANYRLGRIAQARADCETALTRARVTPGILLELTWLLATCPELKPHDPRQAVELARKAVQLSPQTAGCWTTLGLAHYRAGDGKAAIAALEKSVELDRGQ